MYNKTPKSSNIDLKPLTAFNVSLAPTKFNFLPTIANNRKVFNLTIKPTKSNQVIAEPTRYEYASAVLGNNADNFSAIQDTAILLRNLAYERHDAMRKVLEHYRDENNLNPFFVPKENGYKRVFKPYNCRTMTIPNENARVMLGANGSARYAGLQVCDNPFCPFCAVKYSYIYTDMITKGIAEYKKLGYEMAFVTLTLSHKASDTIEKVHTAISSAYQKMISGRAWVKLSNEFSIAPSVKRLEITLGDNGYHVHLHLLIPFKGNIDSLGSALMARWMWALDQTGAKYNARCFDIKSGHSATADYLAKFGTEPKSKHEKGIEYEMTKTANKVAKKRGLAVMQALDMIYSNIKNGSDNAELIQKIGALYAYMRGKRTIELNRFLSFVGLNVTELRESAELAYISQNENEKENEKEIVTLLNYELKALKSIVNARKLFLVAIENGLDYMSLLGYFVDTYERAHNRITVYLGSDDRYNSTKPTYPIPSRAVKRARSKSSITTKPLI